MVSSGMLDTASVVPSSPIVTLMKEALSSSETSVLTRAKRRNIQEDAILLILVVIPLPNISFPRHSARFFVPPIVLSSGY
jgi:hypothetical protein